MPLLVPRAEVLPDEGAVAVGKVAVVDLLWVVCIEISMVSTMR